jgi:hypothetical protein
VVQTLKDEGLDDEVFGADILFDALAEPMRQIAENGALLRWCLDVVGWCGLGWGRVMV